MGSSRKRSPARVTGVRGKSCPVFHRITAAHRTPLTGCLTSKRSISFKVASDANSQPCNMYVGENFYVQMYKYFTIRQLVVDKNSAGVAHTNFESIKATNAMSLSIFARKLRDVPNAGGSSVTSEVLSYELLHSCFGAVLMKVRFSSWSEYLSLN